MILLYHTIYPHYITLYIHTVWFWHDTVWYFEEISPQKTASESACCGAPRWIVSLQDTGRSEVGGQDPSISQRIHRVMGDGSVMICGGDGYLGSWPIAMKNEASDDFTVRNWMGDLDGFGSCIGSKTSYFEHISDNAWSKSLNNFSQPARSVGIPQGPSSLLKDVPICYFVQVWVETTKDSYSWVHPDVQSGAVFCTQKNRSLQS